MAPPWHDARVLRRNLPIVLAVGALALAACNDDGRTLAPAPTVPISPLTTAPPTSEPTVVAPPEVGQPIDISSPDVAEGEVLDATFTCDGLNVSPELTITGTPLAAAELGIVVLDADGDGGIRWAITGIDPTTVVIERGVTPRGAVTAEGSTGIVGWDGPCPPPGDPLRTYHFTVFAVPEPLGLAEGGDAQQALAALESAAIARDTLVVFYGADGG